MIQSITTYTGTHKVVKPVQLKISTKKLNSSASSTGSRVYKLKPKSVKKTSG